MLMYLQIHTNQEPDVTLVRDGQFEITYFKKEHGSGEKRDKLKSLIAAKIASNLNDICARLNYNVKFNDKTFIFQETFLQGALLFFTKKLYRVIELNKKTAQYNNSIVDVLECLVNLLIRNRFNSLALKKLDEKINSLLEQFNCF